jgi:hypothetical protein
LGHWKTEQGWNDQVDSQAAVRITPERADLIDERHGWDVGGSLDASPKFKGD